MSIGVSVGPDLAVVAIVDVNFQNAFYANARPIRVQCFSKHDLTPFSPCPFIDDWRQHITVYDGKLHLVRAIQDIMTEEGESYFAYDAHEMETDDSGVSVTKEQYESVFDRLSFGELIAVAKKDRKSSAAMTMYFVRSFGNDKDRPEIMKAILLAVAGVYVRHENQQAELRKTI